ncbi:MAG: leucine-rich repeat domain-containing protein, partial [Thermoguttaceae bacterium]|nr:leucine-rich repeat domain-containing protein [Thermoguttaceae bacterium]
LASYDVEEGNSLYRSIDGVLFFRDGKTLIKCPEGKVAEVYTVPDGVVTIKSRAFSHCDSIEAIVFSNGVKYIEDAAISDCARLKSLTLPNDYQRIEDESENKLFNQLFQWPCLPMLSGTNELASINVPENGRSFKSIDGVLYDGTGLTLLKCPKNNEIENFVIPDSVQALQAGAFAECSALKTIAIHEGVGHVEENSFIGCSGLTAINVAEKNPPCKSIDGVLFMRNGGGNPIALVKYPSASDRESYEVPNTVTKICNRAFADSRSLKSVKIPEKVEEIGFGTFLDCDALESIDVDENNPQYFSIDGVLFNEDRALLSGEGPSLLQYPLGSAVENYVVPEGVKSIDASAFRGCSALKSVKFSKDVAFYGMNAFRDCSALTTFEVDGNNARFSANDGVLFSKDGAILYKCPMGKKADVYEVPEGVKKIGHRAFVDCAGLTSIKIPEGVKKLGREAFANCSGLKTIELPASVDDIPLDAFPVDQELTIRAPKGSEAAYFVKRFAPGSGLKLELIE